MDDAIGVEVDVTALSMTKTPAIQQHGSPVTDGASSPSTVETRWRALVEPYRPTFIEIAPAQFPCHRGLAQSPIVESERRPTVAPTRCEMLRLVRLVHSSASSARTR